jgi:phosphatidate phosphatase APP1
MRWKEFVYRFANRSEHYIDKFLLQFRQRLGWKTKVYIQAYSSFGFSSSLLVKGRVLHRYEFAPHENKSRWQNLADMYRRFNSHEIKGALLKISYHEFSSETTTDEDGYFEAVIKYSDRESHLLWHYPSIELLESPVPFPKPLVAFAKVMVPPVDADYGIISDIDDTIVASHATDLIRMLYTTFTSNALSRLPFKGVPEFYSLLQNGRTGSNRNPIFYVSSSPWNLYDFITDFIRINKIPEGPVLLKDYGFTHNKFFSENHTIHKKKLIVKILTSYPTLSFFLVGDSGQDDPEIYASVIKEFPNRILAVFLRDVTLAERKTVVTKIYSEFSSIVPMIYSQDTTAAQQFCLEKGYIIIPPGGN